MRQSYKNYYKTGVWVALRNIVFTFLVALMVPFESFSTTYKFETITGGDYLTTNNTNAIVEGENGFIWIASNQGLIRLGLYSSWFYLHEPDNEKSLSSNVVNDIIFDCLGYLWLATENGLNKFNLESGQFEVFESDPKIEDSINHNTINVIEKSSDGMLWLGTKNGLSEVNPKTGAITRHFYNIDVGEQLSSEDIVEIFIDAKDNLWLSSKGKGVIFYEPKTRHFKRFKESDGLSSNDVVSIIEVSEGELWFGHSKNGIDSFNTQSGAVTNLSFSIELIGDMKVLHNGQIWIGTLGQGIFVLEKSEGDVRDVDEQYALRVHQVKSSDNDPFGLMDNTIKDIFQDSNNNVWLATHYRGVMMLRDSFFNASDFRKENASWHGLSSNSVWAATEDDAGRVWVGTSSKLHILDSEEKTNYSPPIEGIAFDVKQRKNGEIWVATDHGLIIFDSQLNIIRKHFVNKDEPFYKQTLLSLHEDASQQMWVGTFGSGVLRFSPEGRSYQTFSHTGKKGDIGNGPVTAFVEEPNGNFWIANKEGLYKFLPITHTFEKIPDSPENIWSMVSDEAENILWLGTTDKGLVKYNIPKHQFTYIAQKQGLAGNSVLCLISDDTGLWVGTNQGLSHIFQQDEKQDIVNYYNYHGLQDGYNYNACHKGDKGKLYFGGGTGLSYFYPDQLQFDTTVPSVVLMGFNIYDSKSNQFTKLPLSRLTEEVSPQLRSVTPHENVLAHFQNNIRFDFSGIYFTWPEALTIQHRLLGYNDQWQESQPSEPNTKSPKSGVLNASYTNLSEGLYRFQIRAFSPDGVASKLSELTFRITPPFWKTKAAYAIYLIVALLILWAVVHLRTLGLLKQRARLEHEVSSRTRLLSEKTSHAEKLLEEKKRLFSSVSHEFKTPLTIILANAQDLQANVILRSATRLLRMVEQMLALSKLEHQQPKKVKLELTHIFNQLFSLLDSLFMKKGIRVELSRSEPISVYFEEEGFEQVALNLLTNVIKYAHEDSIVRVNIKQEQSSVFIAIEDEGQGITASDSSKIFERFFRTENSERSSIPGAGVGLAIVKELVVRNDGEVWLDDTYKKGCRFVIRLPAAINEEAASADTVSLSSTYTESAVVSVPPQIIKTNSLDKRKTVLIIEDNPDLQHLLYTCLSQHVNCLQAFNGETGIEVALEQVPDLIISDIMMGNVDGFDVLKAVKENTITSHIPIILLTALGSSEYRLKGWNTLADEYLVKPFDRNELVARTKNLLSIRDSLAKRFKEAYANQQTIDADLVGVNAKESEFIQQFSAIIEASFHLKTLSRGEVANQLAMSERQLNRKLAALLDYNFNEYLRKYRLRESLKYIGKGCQMWEICDGVGFSNLTYFSSCFKAEYGLSFKQYEKKVKAGDIAVGTLVE